MLGKGRASLSPVMCRQSICPSGVSNTPVSGPVAGVDTTAVVWLATVGTDLVVGGAAAMACSSLSPAVNRTKAPSNDAIVRTQITMKCALRVMRTLCPALGQRRQDFR